MCNDLTASKNATIISIISCWILYTNAFHQNKKIHKTLQVLALFFLFVSLMQIYDWIFWENLNKSKINYIFTKIAMISNHLQPIIYALLINYLIKPIDGSSIFVLILYSIYAFIYSVYYWNQIDYTLVSKESSPALYWKWNFFKGAEILYLLFLISLSFTSLNLVYPLNYIMVLINIISFFFSLYVFKKEIVGQLWCVIASYIPVFLIFLENSVKFV